MRSDNVYIDYAAYAKYAQNATLTDDLAKFEPVLGAAGGLQTAILNVVPKYSAVTLLFQLNQRKSFVGLSMPLSFLTWPNFSSNPVSFLDTIETIDATRQKVNELVSMKVTDPSISTEKRAKIQEEANILIRLLDEHKIFTQMVLDVSATLNLYLHV